MLYSFEDFIGESLDKTLPIMRDTSPLAYVLDQWSFDMGPTTHIVRFEKGKKFGSRVSEIRFGVKRGTKISPALTGISDMRVYLATVMKAIDDGLADPTSKMKLFKDGFVIVIPDKIWERFGVRATRILKMKYRSTHKIADYHDISSIYDKRVGVYLYKRGKTFGNVFSEIDTNIPEPIELEDIPTKAEIAPLPIKTSVVSTVKEVKPKLSAPETKSPLATAKVIETKPQFDREALYKSVPKIEYTIPELENAWYRLLWATTVMHGGFNDTPAAVSPETYEKALRYKKMFPSMKVDSQKLAFVFDAMGVKTRLTYSSYGKSYSSNSYFKANFPSDTDPRTLFPASKSISTDTAVKIMINIDDEYIKAMKRLGVDSPNPFPEKYGPGGETPSFYNIDHEALTDDELRDLIFSLMQDATLTIPKEELLKTEISGAGTKYEKERLRPAYSQEFKDAGYDVDDQTKALIREWIYRGDSVDELIRRIDMFPSHITSTLTGLNAVEEDYDIWSAHFIDTWLISGGTSSYSISGNASKSVGVNATMDEEAYWVHNSDKAEGFASPKLKSEFYSHPRVVKQFETMYDNTQKFYQEKLKKKYEGATVKLFRGIGVDGAKSYVPAPMESWSKDVSTAKAFAKMMGGYSSGDGTIMIAEVPIKYIIASYEANADTWLSEADLKGKKEYVVMGGAFNDIPIYTFYTKNKTTGDQLNFKEYVDMVEGKYDESREQIKIVTPKNMTKNTGRGVEPDEDLTRAHPKDTNNKRRG